MAITFTPGLTPTFHELITDSAKESEKQIVALITAGTAYENKLQAPITAMTTRMDTVIAALNSDRGTAAAEIGFASSPNTLAFFAANSLNLPASFTAGGGTFSDMQAIHSAAVAYEAAAQACITAMNNLKGFVSTVDVDNFKLHMDLLSGIRFDVPGTIEKPNLFGLMGTVMSITDLRDRFGETFINYLVLLFGTLFTADDTIAAAKAHVDTDPIPTTYASLGVLTRVQANPFNESPSTIISDINAVTGTVTPYTALVVSHQANFQTHITDDTNEFNAATALLEKYIFAMNISSHFRDDYYKFMYTDVFGSTAIKSIIQQIDDGTIE